MSRANEMVYPCEGPNATAYGLTIREHFAAMAMQGLLANSGAINCNDSVAIATRAIDVADHLIAELAKPVQP